jgi:hypothetical protein
VTESLIIVTKECAKFKKSEGFKQIQCFPAKIMWQPLQHEKLLTDHASENVIIGSEQKIRSQAGWLIIKTKRSVSGEDTVKTISSIVCEIA